MNVALEIVVGNRLRRPRMTEVALFAIAHEIIEERVALGKSVRIRRILAAVEQKRRISICARLVTKHFVEVFVLFNDKDKMFDGRERRWRRLSLEAVILRNGC